MSISSGACQMRCLSKPARGLDLIIKSALLCMGTWANLIMPEPNPQGTLLVTSSDTVQPVYYCQLQDEGCACLLCCCDNALTGSGTIAH